MPKIIDHIKSYLFLSDYEKSIPEKDITERNRLKLYRNTIPLGILFAYLSLAFQSDVYYGQSSLFILGTHVLFIGNFVNYILLNKHKNAILAYTLSMASFYLLLHIVTYKAGGIKHAGGAYLICLILFSYMLSGKKIGNLFVIASIGHFIYFYFISTYTNLTDYSLLKNRFEKINLEYAVTFSICTIFIWLQASFIENQTTETVRSHIDASAALVKKEKEEIRLQQLVAESNLKTLRSQMNPHFIFNSLNSISNYILKADTANANLYLTKFSVLIRKILQHTKDAFINLPEEVKLLQLYLELEQLRFGDKMKFSISISEGLLEEDIRIPSMVIQPYIENAVKHGIAPLLNRSGLITIDFNRTADFLLCTIDDDGIGIHKSLLQHSTSGEHQSMGTSIIDSRINIINEMRVQRITSEVIDKNEINPQQTGTIIKLSFPLVYE
jgi:sensor histidine kinase YesM